MELGVAPGFPNISMEPYDIVIPQSFADYFGIQNAESFNNKILVTIDLLKLLALSDEHK
jgi:hypothetical protein